MRKKARERKKETRACKTCPLSAVCLVALPAKAVESVFHCYACGAWWSIVGYNRIGNRIVAVPWEPCDVLVRQHADANGWILVNCPYCRAPRNKAYVGEVVYEAYKERGDGTTRVAMRLVT